MINHCNNIKLIEATYCVIFLRLIASSDQYLPAAWYVCVILSRSSLYTQSNFRRTYADVMKKSHVQQNNGTSNMTSDLPVSDEENLFDYPFNELLVSVCFKFAVRELYLTLSLNRAF
jgi:hypothetical protein